MRICLYHISLFLALFLSNSCIVQCYNYSASFFLPLCIILFCLGTVLLFWVFSFSFVYRIPINLQFGNAFTLLQIPYVSLVYAALLNSLVMCCITRNDNCLMCEDCSKESSFNICCKNLPNRIHVYNLLRNRLQIMLSNTWKKNYTIQFAQSRYRKNESKPRHPLTTSSFIGVALLMLFLLFGERGH